MSLKKIHSHMARCGCAFNLINTIHLGLVSQNRMLQVEPAIIGGVIIDIGDKHIDLSINTRIKKIQQLLMETV